jgi:hypothetical protein
MDTASTQETKLIVVHAELVILCQVHATPEQPLSNSNSSYLLLEQHVQFVYPQKKAQQNVARNLIKYDEQSAEIFFLQ